MTLIDAHVYTRFCHDTTGHSGYASSGDAIRPLGGTDGGGLATRGVRSEGVPAVGGGWRAVFLCLRPCVPGAQHPHPAQRGHVASSSAGTFFVGHIQDGAVPCGAILGGAGGVYKLHDVYDVYTSRC